MRGLTLPGDGDAPLHVLAVGAHADDIEIGAGGLLLELAAARPGLEAHLGRAVGRRRAVRRGAPERRRTAGRGRQPDHRALRPPRALLPAPAGAQAAVRRPRLAGSRPTSSWRPVSRTATRTTGRSPSSSGRPSATTWSRVRDRQVRGRSRPAQSLRSPGGGHRGAEDRPSPCGPIPARPIGAGSARRRSARSCACAASRPTPSAATPRRSPARKLVADFGRA
jgi:hypothetical protein